MLSGRCTRVDPVKVEIAVYGIEAVVCGLLKVNWLPSWGEQGAVWDSAEWVCRWNAEVDLGQLRLTNTGSY